MNLDRRRHYILVLDTETANTQTTDEGKLDMSSVLPYDIGYCIMDTKGNIYLERSFVVDDIFCEEWLLTTSAYYAKKIPMYIRELAKQNRTLTTAFQIRKQVHEDIEHFQIKEVCAHNARFDINALNNLMRWVSKSRIRYFFPYGIEVWDSLAMARSVIAKMPTYRKYCEKNNLLTPTGRLSMTAESLYRFVRFDDDFEESHTGLEDVRIEREIILYCYRQHKAMKKNAFTKKS